MLKKKLIFGLSITAGVITAASLITAGYLNNKTANRYQIYGKAPVTASTTDLIQAYFSSIVNGSKLLYLASFAHTTPLTEALEIKRSVNPVMFNTLSKAGFILIDDAYGAPKLDDNGLFSSSIAQPIWSTNASSVQFRSDLGSFVTGIAAGQFLNDNKAYFTAGSSEKEKKLTWATYGGLPFPSVTSFMGGFQRGIEWFNKNVAAYNPNYLQVEQVLLGEDDSKNFTFTFDVTAASSLVTPLLNEHVDLILPVAGRQIMEVTRLVKTFQKRTVVIGVDSPAEEDTSTNTLLGNLPSNGEPEVGGTNKIIQFSTVKNINIMAKKVTSIINNPSILTENVDNPEWKNLGGIGYSSLGNVDNNGVGVSDAGKPYFIKAIKAYADRNSLQLDLTNDNNSDYSNATKLLSGLEDFTKLDNPENKYYLTRSYASIANSGSEMFPITGTKEDRIAWYDKNFANNEKAIANKSINIDEIENWIDKNKIEIEDRSKTTGNLKGQFTKEKYDQNNGLIRIILDSSTSILFDKSFYESCYLGLYQYWKDMGVETMPAPPSK